MSACTTYAQDLGVPVKSVNWVRLHPGRTAAGRPLLLASMGQNSGGLFACDIDIQSGHCTQYSVELPYADYPTASMMDPDTGILYIGSAYTGHLHRLDPNLPESARRLEDLGPIADPEETRFPCRIDRHPDGSIWIGAHGDCSLTRFDPATAEFRRFGRMDATDQYFYPWCGRDGTLAGLVQTCRVHVVAVNPHTGEHRTVGPTLDVDAAGGSEAKQCVELFRAVDGLLYLRSHEGNFRIVGMDAIPIDDVPEAEGAPALPDGTTVEMVDARSGINRTVSFAAPDGNTREVTLDWQGGGTHVYLLHEGPEGKLYGSSILPEHLFVARRDGSCATDLGQCSRSLGEAYSMGNLGGKLYIASYPEARLSVYDPDRPYRFGEDADANPRDLGRVDEVAYRPRDMLTGPAGKVWMASVPDYGMWGGTLASYDPGTGAFSSHRHIVRDASPVSLTYIPGMNRILVGTSIAGGSGTTPRIDRTAFALWDPDKDALDRTTDFGLEGLVGVPSLAYGGNECTYAVVHMQATSRQCLDEDAPGIMELMLLDVAADLILDRQELGEDIGWPLEVCLTHGPDGSLYGWGRKGLFRIAPGTARVTMVWTVEGDSDMAHAPGPILDGRAFFATGHRLRCVDLE